MTHCTDEPLYTGISTDVEKPYAQYALQKGGEYFRDQKSKQLVYLEKGRGRSSASTRESAIKKLLRVDKILLISSLHNQINKNIGIDI